MDQLTHIGLDVHKESTAVAILRAHDREPDHRVIASTPEAYRKLFAPLSTESLAPTGNVHPSATSASRNATCSPKMVR